MAKAFVLRLVSVPTDEDLSVGAPVLSGFSLAGSLARGLCALGLNAIHPR